MQKIPNPGTALVAFLATFGVAIAIESAVAPAAFGKQPGARRSARIAAAG